MVAQRLGEGLEFKGVPAWYFLHEVESEVIC